MNPRSWSEPGFWQDPKSEVWHDPNLNWSFFPRPEVRTVTRNDFALKLFPRSTGVLIQIRSPSCDTKWFCTGVVLRSEVRTVTRKHCALECFSKIHRSFDPRSEVKSVKKQDPKSKLWYEIILHWIFVSSMKSEQWHEIMLHRSLFQDPLEFWSKIRSPNCDTTHIRSPNCDTKRFCTGVCFKIHWSFDPRSEVRPVTRNVALQLFSRSTGLVSKIRSPNWRNDFTLDVFQ